MAKSNKKITSKFWFFPINLPLKETTNQEKKWSSNLSKTRRKEFLHSRCYARFALSEIFNINPLLIPLIAEPGKPPILEKDFGFISFSHCKDGLFLGWSNSKIGVDIESINRSIDSKKISENLFSDHEKYFMNNGEEKEVNEKFLSIWVMKEALIKYSQGNILRDFKSWRIDFLSKKASKSDQILDVFSYYFKYKSWIIGIASEEKLLKIPNIININ